MLNSLSPGEVTKPCAQGGKMRFTLLMAFSQLPLLRSYANLLLSVSISREVSVHNTCLVVTDSATENIP